MIVKIDFALFPRSFGKIGRFYWCGLKSGTYLSEDIHNFSEFFKTVTITEFKLKFSYLEIPENRKFIFKNSA